METWNILDSKVITSYTLAKMTAQKVILHIEPSFIRGYDYAAAGTVDFLAAIIWCLHKRSKSFKLLKAASLPHAISFAIGEPEKVLDILSEDKELTIGLQPIDALWQQGRNLAFLAQVRAYQGTIAKMKSPELFWIFGGKHFPCLAAGVTPQEALTFLLYRYQRLEKSYPQQQFPDNLPLQEDMNRRPFIVEMQTSIIMKSKQTALDIA